MKLVWFPQWLCQNYTFGNSFGSKCPYCPYSFDLKSNRLIFEDSISAPNNLAPYDDILGFFRVNAHEIGHFLEISGGEPLLYPDLDRMLGTEGIGHGWMWAITSNTLATPMINRMIKTAGGFLGGCVGWTASYHPFSNSDELFAKNIRLVAEHARNIIRATVVVSEETLPQLLHARTFLETLPIAGMNWHLQSHCTTAEKNSSLLERARAIVGDIHPVAGYFPRNKICAKRDKLLAVGADGSIYECVTKCYQHVDPIGRANSEWRISDLEPVNEVCGLECFAICDHIKHIA